MKTMSNYNNIVCDDDNILKHASNLLVKLRQSMLIAVIFKQLRDNIADSRSDCTETVKQI